MRQTILSGVQPSGDLHLGNFIGALRQWSSLLDDYNCFFCIVDLHALTDPDAVPDLRLVERVRDVAALYVASGIDPNKCAIFAQSGVAEHVRLMWLLTCVTPLGALERMTQFKSKGSARDRIDAGLLLYPVLQAADILAYDTDLVPVGDDQKQHIELARDIATRFNSLYGETFKLPRARIPLAGARVMGLDNPTEKMSKSLAGARPNHAISMLDSPAIIKRKIGKAVTDSSPVVDPDSMGAGTRNLVEIFAALSNQSTEKAAAELAGKSYRDLKGELTELVINSLTPVQQRYHEVRSDVSQIDSILTQGATTARAQASKAVGRAEAALRLRD